MLGSANLSILETDRLLFREPNEDDAPFVLAQLNEPAWLQHIGDKGVRTEEDETRLYGWAKSDR